MSTNETNEFMNGADDSTFDDFNNVDPNTQVSKHTGGLDDNENYEDDDARGPIMCHK